MFLGARHCKFTTDSNLFSRTSVTCRNRRLWLSRRHFHKPQLRDFIFMSKTIDVSTGWFSNVPLGTAPCQCHTCISIISAHFDIDLLMAFTAAPPHAPTIAIAFLLVNHLEHRRYGFPRCPSEPGLTKVHTGFHTVSHTLAWTFLVSTAPPQVPASRLHVYNVKLMQYQQDGFPWCLLGTHFYKFHTRFQHLRGFRHRFLWPARRHLDKPQYRVRMFNP